MGRRVPDHQHLLSGRAGDRRRGVEGLLGQDVPDQRPGDGVKRVDTGVRSEVDPAAYQSASRQIAVGALREGVLPDQLAGGEAKPFRPGGETVGAAPTSAKSRVLVR